MAGPSIVATITATDETKAAFASLEANTRRATQAINSMGGAQSQTAREYLALQDKHARAQAVYNRELERSHSLLKGMAAQAIAFTAIWKGAETIKAGIGEAARQQQELVRMRNAGIAPREVDALDKQSIGLMTELPGMNRSEILERARELHAILLNPERDEANLLPGVVKAQRILDSASDSAHGLGSSLTPVIKSLESMGLTLDKNAFATTLESYTKALQVFGGGQLNAETYRGAVQTAGSAANFWSPEFRDKIFPAVVNEFGDRSGTMLNQFSKEFMGGFKDSHGAIQEAIALGLINKSDVAYTKTGEAKNLLPGHHVAGHELASANPLEWVEKVLKPAIDKAGITKPEDLQAVIRALAPNKSVSAFIAKAIEQGELWRKDEANINAATGFKGDMTDDPVKAYQWLGDSIHGLIASLANPAMAPAAHGMSELTSGITRLTAIMTTIGKENPGLVMKSEAAAVTAAIYSGYRLLFGPSARLTAAAAALDASAAALDRAAVAIAAGGKTAAVAGGIQAGELAAGGAATATAAAGLGWRALIGRVGIPVAIGMMLADATKATRDYLTGIQGDVLGNPDASQADLRQAIHDAEKNNSGSWLSNVTLVNLRKQLAERKKADADAAKQRAAEYGPQLPPRPRSFTKSLDQDMTEWPLGGVPKQTLDIYGRNTRVYGDLSGAAELKASIAVDPSPWFVAHVLTIEKGLIELKGTVDSGESMTGPNAPSKPRIGDFSFGAFK